MTRLFRALCLDICILGFVAGPLFAGETLTVDGVRYEDIRWGPASQGKVVLFHNHGVATLPIEKLPPDVQRRLGYSPKPTPDDTETIVIDDPVQPPPTNSPPILSSSPRQLTGFVRFRAELKEDNRVSRALIIELAERRDQSLRVPANVELRPGLWKPTGQLILVKDCPLTNDVGMLVRVYALEVGRIKDYRAFTFSQPPPKTGQASSLPINRNNRPNP